MDSTDSAIIKLQEALNNADAVVIGAGAGLSASAGFTYSGKRFNDNFADFHEKYGFSDMYDGGFYPYESLEEFWAFWSRNIFINRYSDIPLPVYKTLFELVKNRDYFVITTNVDHCFQRTGFNKERLFYTQGDYGLFQCSEPCYNKTYDNENAVRSMIAEQRDMRIPTECIPHCPICGKPMSMNLRCDDTFVEDDGWNKAAARYSNYLHSHQGKKTLFLELGVGGNTPVIIKYPFQSMTHEQPKAFYACINKGDAAAPRSITDRSIAVNADIGTVLSLLK